MKFKKIRTHIIYILLLLSLESYAQWQPSLGLEGGQNNDIVVLDSFLFTTCANSIYRTDTNFTNPWVISTDNYTGENLFVKDSCVISYGIMDQMRRSFDNGITWSTVSDFSSTITMCSIDSIIFFRDNIDLYKSNDYLATIEQISTLPQVQWWGIYSFDSLLFAVDISLNNIYQSLDAGITWDTITKIGLPTDGYLTTNMICYNNTIWLGGFEGVFYLNDSKTSWIEVGLGLPETKKVKDLIVYNSEIYCAINSDFYSIIHEDGLYRLNWVNSTWEYLEGSSKDILSLDVINEELYIGTSAGPIKMDNVNNWYSNYSGLLHRNISSFSMKNDTILVFANDELFRSLDDGLNFEKIDNIYGKQIITTDSIYYTRSYYDILLSRDYGNSWDTITNGLQSHLKHFSLTENYIFVCTSHGLFRTKVDTINWILLENGISAEDMYYFEVIDSVVIVSDHHEDLICKSSDYGNSFDTLLTTNGGFFPIQKKDNRFYILYNEDILYSDDLGETWDEINTPHNTHRLDQDETCLVVGGDYSGPWPSLFMSYDNGQTWEYIEDNLPVDMYGIFWTINFHNQRLFVSSRDNSLWYRDDIITTISNNEINDHISINPFPNPTSDIITLEIPSYLNEVNYKVCDIQGRLFLSGSISYTKNKIDIRELNSGIYIVKVYTMNNMVSSKIIKLD